MTEHATLLGFLPALLLAIGAIWLIRTGSATSHTLREANGRRDVD